MREAPGSTSACQASVPPRTDCTPRSRPPYPEQSEPINGARTMVFCMSPPPCGPARGSRRWWNGGGRYGGKRGCVRGPAASGPELPGRRRRSRCRCSVKGVGGVPERYVRKTEGVADHQRGHFARIHRVGLVTEVLGSLQKGELVRHRTEGGGHLASRFHSGGEVADDPGRVGIQVRRCSPEENLVAQGGDHLAEFRDLLGDRHAVRSAVRISGDRELAAKSIEVLGCGPQGSCVGYGGGVHGAFQRRGVSYGRGRRLQLGPRDRGRTVADPGAPRGSFEGGEGRRGELRARAACTWAG
ncbi:hypothetical protein A3Q37_02730 [Streptomyces sp. PTY087I2]|nr:hypothetical protein A3Q37_02730 [Streptomyces sp. PTY087I2]